MLLQPKKTKYSKAHKGRLSMSVSNNSRLCFGSFGIVSKEPARIHAVHLSAAEFAIKRVLRKSGEYWIRVFPQVPVSKKPAEVRMGKGKGAIEFWAARIRTGTILIEIEATPVLARTALQVALSKLPIAAKIIEKNDIRYNFIYNRNNRNSCE